MRRLVESLALFVTGTLLLISPSAAQTPASSPTPGPWAAEFDQALTTATSDRQREILADDQITQAEYDELKLAWARCMTDHGFPGTLAPEPYVPGGYQYVSPAPPEPLGTPQASGEGPFDAFAAADETCSAIMGPVEALFGRVVTNPHNEDWAALQYACALRHELIPESMSQGEFATADATGDWPVGVNLFTDRFATCFINPLEVPVNPAATPIAP